MSEKELLELHKQKLLDIKEMNELKSCENCILGKSKRIKFSQATRTIQEKLSYIHADLWGTARVVTMEGTRYFMSLIDDKSRKVWIYLLKTKDEAFSVFKVWKRKVENHTGLKVKNLKIDND